MTTLEHNETEVHREELGNLFALQDKLTGSVGVQYGL